MLKEQIDSIGEEVVACALSCKGVPCEGVQHNRSQGILPRCLFLELEEEREPQQQGCVVVGINPGESTEKERDYFRQSGCSYKEVREHFLNEFVRTENRYYGHLREFVTEIGLAGPILWSDVAKCEKAHDAKEVPLQTLRTCASYFLRRELEAAPGDWPVIGVGKDAYTALAYLAPTRAVLGIPHPTGSRGHFAGLSRNGRLREEVIAQAHRVLAKKSASWLPEVLKTPR